MASNSETGHAKNVANFEKIIAFLISYAAAYNPVKTIIKLVTLQAQLLQAQTDMSTVSNKIADKKKKENNRKIVFEPIEKYCTRLINALAASDATDELIEDARTINRKIQGARKSKIDKPADPNAPVDPNAPKNISASQHSFDMMVEHFTNFLEIIKTEPSYNPNEADLKVTAATAFLASLKAANTAVFNAETAIANARIARNKTLYKSKTGVHDVVADIKKYLVSVYGASAPEYKQVNKISITLRED